MKKYRFIRTGDRPIEESDYDHIIREGFNACTNEVKAKLESFFKDVSQQSLVFEFDGQTVEIKREIKA